VRRDAGVLAERAEALRRLHTGPTPLVLPNAWDVAGARAVVKAGFPVVATSSGAVAATLGYEDDDSMPVDEAFGVIARIARNASVPVTADVEAGYGISPEDLVARLLDTGAVGCNVETPPITAVAGSSTPASTPNASVPSVARRPWPASRSS
jgi:2-methylisocitrate lyase-like PEP mutase family enzyme